MADGYKVNNDRLPEPDNKLISRGDTYHPIINMDVIGMLYTTVYHQAVNEMQQTFMRWKIIHQCLDLPHSICPLLAWNIFNEVILVDTKKIIKVPNIDFGELLWFIDIWQLIKENPGMNPAEHFREKHIDLFSGCSIRVKQFMYGKF